MLEDRRAVRAFRRRNQDGANPAAGFAGGLWEPVPVQAVVILPATESQERPEETVVESAPEAATPAPVEQTAPAQAAAAVVEASPAEQTAPAQAAAAVVEAPPAEQTAPAQAAVAVAEAPPAAPPAPQARPPEAQQQPRPAPERAPQPTGREPINMKALLEAGVHFGHQTRRWNPTMKTLHLHPAQTASTLSTCNRRWA